MTSHMDKAELLVHGKEVAKQSVHNYVRNVVFETLSKISFVTSMVVQVLPEFGPCYPKIGTRKQRRAGRLRSWHQQETNQP